MGFYLMEGFEMKKISLLLFCLLCYLPSVGYAADDEEIHVAVSRGAETVTHQVIDENVLLVSVRDVDDNPIKGLTLGDFTITKGQQKAKILSVESLEKSREVGLNIVFVIDNSASMEQRNAVEPLLSALSAFLEMIRPIDKVTLILFDDRRSISIDGRNLHVKTFQSNDPQTLREFVGNQFEKGMTDKTVLYEAMLAGIDVAKRLPAKENKFLVVFSDGKDLNSAYETSEVISASAGIDNLEVFAVDYMPDPELDPFLKTFSETHGGQILKASSATDLLPIFQSFATKLIHRYIVTYTFLFPPKGRVKIWPERATIEEVTTIDSAPLLNYIYFEKGESEISPRYQLLDQQSDTRAFDAGQFKGALEKYRHVLNVFGRRLADHPETRITIVGCNSNYGKEKRKLELSRGRAEAVQAYLRYIWGIDPSRMTVKARNRPEAPSTNRIEAGRVENQRVEIHSDTAAIMDTVQSTYMEIVSDEAAILVEPNIIADHGVESWWITLYGDGVPFHEINGQGRLNPDYPFLLKELGLKKIGRYETIGAKIKVRDTAGHAFETFAENQTMIRFIKRDERVSQKMGFKVLEKYALILFDYDSAEIKDRNRIIVDRIIERMKVLQNVALTITGHTDTIGERAYNQKLSERRAKAVYDQMIAAGMTAGENITFKGVGPDEPLYDNTLPEGRALNRTVTVTLEYQQTQ